MKSKMLFIAASLFMVCNANAGVIGSNEINSGESISLAPTSMMLTVFADSNGKFDPSSSSGAFSMNQTGTMVTCSEECSVSVVNTAEDATSAVVTVLDGSKTETVTVLSSHNLKEPNNNFEQNVITPFATLNRYCQDVNGTVISGEINGFETSLSAPLVTTATIRNQKVSLIDSAYDAKTFNYINDTLKTALEEKNNVGICIENNNMIKYIGTWIK